MDELVRLVVQRAGISEQQARTAVATVLNLLKERLPGPMAAQIDAVLMGGNIDDIAKGVGGLFGKK